MKASRLIGPATGVGCVGAIFMATTMVLALYGATAGVSRARPLTIRVRYDDLNLSSASGVDAFRNRVLHAAEQVCGDSDKLERSVKYHGCVMEATNRGLAKVGLASQ
jgi:UrcA family protein